MSVTDAEKAFYEMVLAEPEGKSIQDLRYAYFLAAIDGGLPAPSVSWDDISDVPSTFPPESVSIPSGVTATGTPSATTFLRGDGVWSAPAQVASQADIQNPASTTGRLITGQRFSQGFSANMTAIPGYNSGVAQTLTHDASGVLTWVASA